MKSFESVGKNVEEAVQNGLRAMNLTKADVDIKILNKGGWFSKARVLITATDDSEENQLKTPVDSEKIVEKTAEMQKNEVETTQKTSNAQQQQAKTISEQSEKTNKEILEDNSTFSSQTVLEGQSYNKKEPKHLIVKDSNPKNIEIAKNFLLGLFKQMNVQAEIEVLEDEMSVILEVKTASSGLLIGKHGDTMQALQSILNTFLNSKNAGYKKILVDIENYRQKQVEKIEQKAKDAIEMCVQKAKPVSLDYMNSYERHIVHELVIQDGRVVSESFGKEPRRFVKIFIK